MERHTSSTTHTHTEDSWHFQPMQLPLWGSKGPKSLLGTRSVQQSLAKRKFSSTLGQSLPVSKRKNRPTCWLIKFFSKPCSIQNLLPQSFAKKRKHVCVFWTDYLPVQCWQLVKVPSSEPYFLWGFVACIVFILSPVIFTQVEGAELNFLFNICYAAQGEM